MYEVVKDNWKNELNRVLYLVRRLCHYPIDCENLAADILLKFYALEQNATVFRPVPFEIIRNDCYDALRHLRIENRYLPMKCEEDRIAELKETVDASLMIDEGLESKPTVPPIERILSTISFTMDELRYLRMLMMDNPPIGSHKKADFLKWEYTKYRTVRETVKTKLMKAFEGTEYNVPN